MPSPHIERLMPAHMKRKEATTGLLIALVSTTVVGSVPSQSERTPPDRTWMMQVEHIGFQELSHTFARRRSILEEKIEAESDPAKRRDLVERLKVLDEHISRNSGISLLGVGRGKRSGGSGETNLQIFLDKKHRRLLRGLKVGDMVELTAPAVDYSGGSIRYVWATAIKAVPDSKLWDGRAGLVPWSYEPPNEVMAAIGIRARLLRIEERLVTRPHRVRASSHLLRVSLPGIRRCNVQLVGDTLAGDRFGPLELVIENRRNKESVDFGVMLPADLMMDKDTLEVRVRDVEFQPQQVRLGRIGVTWNRELDSMDRKGDYFANLTVMNSTREEVRLKLRFLDDRQRLVRDGVIEVGSTTRTPRPIADFTEAINLGGPMAYFRIRRLEVEVLE